LIEAVKEKPSASCLSDYHARFLNNNNVFFAEGGVLIIFRVRKHMPVELKVDLFEGVGGELGFG
jgi:hypothetical protein